MLIRCACCDTEVGLPDKFEKLELSHSADELRVDGEVIRVCRETRARSARARATAIALRDQARVTVERFERLLSEHDAPIEFDAGVAHYAVVGGDGRIDVVVVGEVDVASAASHASVLSYVESLLHAHAVPVVVNTEDVTFCGATGVAFLLQLNNLASDGNVQCVLRGVSEPVRRVLDVAGVGDLGSNAPHETASTGWVGQRV